MMSGQANTDETVTDRASTSCSGDTDTESYYANTYGMSIRLSAMEHNAPLPPLKQSNQAFILFDIIDEHAQHPAKVPEPYPETLNWKREQQKYNQETSRGGCQTQVRMPYCASNWDKIKTCLGQLTVSVKSWKVVFEVMKQYTATDDSDFYGLDDYFSSTQLSQSCLLDLIPKIAKLALELPNVCTQSIPLLRQQKDSLVAMSQYQAACLLANAFFCTFPSTISDDLMHLNFMGLYRSASDRSSSQFAKLDCIFNYFRRVTSNMPTGVITFRRQVLASHDRQHWQKSDVKLVKQLQVSCNGRIETDAPNMLHVDFANMHVGGGMLGHGCVQEEILFMLCPELNVSRLLTEVLGDNETLVITGHQRFNDYDGYAWSFRWQGDYVDTTACDAWGRHTTQLVAMDAQVLWNSDVYDQLSSRCLKRELNKAFCGFQCPDYEQLCTVATGNWGCGAFGGDPGIKFLVQLMAASHAKRPLFYFTFDDYELGNLIYRAHQAAVKTGWSVGDLWQHMQQMAREYGHHLTSEMLLKGIINEDYLHKKSTCGCTV